VAGAGWEVPDFDPASDGVKVKALFLFEKPGPMTATAKGSGLLSIHNDDPTAEAARKCPATDTIVGG
jgi:hypothetical protein